MPHYSGDESSGEVVSLNSQALEEQPVIPREIPAGVMSVNLGPAGSSGEESSGEVDLFYSSNFKEMKINFT